MRLHEQALKCDFADKDKELKQQIELSTNSSKLRKYSFQNPRTLHELVTTAKTFETMKIQTEEIEKHSENEDVSKISRRKFATEKTIRNEQHPQAEKTTTIKDNKRHATGLEVNFHMLTNDQPSGKRATHEGKTDHFARICRSTPQQKMGQNQREETFNNLFFSLFLLSCQQTKNVTNRPVNTRTDHRTDNFPKRQLSRDLLYYKHQRNRNIYYFCICLKC